MKHYKQNITAMVAGMAIGASLVGGAAAGVVAEPTWQKIYVDGQQVSMTAYNIAGNNYVRLQCVLVGRCADRHRCFLHRSCSGTGNCPSADQHGDPGRNDSTNQ